MTYKTYTNPDSVHTLPARVLRVVAASALALSVLDLLVLLMPFEPLNRLWLQNFTSQAIDRGVVPAIGLAFLFWSLWIENRGNPGAPPRQLFKRIGIAIAIVFGILFLILSPIHLLNIRAQAQDTLASIVREARNVEGQIDSDAFKETISRRKSVLRQQAEELMRDDKRFNALIDNPQLSDQQKELLKRARTNPAEMEAFIERQSKEFPLQLIGRIRERRKELEDRARTDAMRSGLQTGLSGLILSAGYLSIAWFGLGVNLFKLSGKSTPRRPS